MRSIQTHKETPMKRCAALAVRAAALLATP